MMMIFIDFFQKTLKLILYIISLRAVKYYFILKINDVINEYCTKPLYKPHKIPCDENFK